jgi:hopene-associated glycosyltransferase HpnB
LVAVVPARNEAASVGVAVGSLLRQDYPGRLSVVLVDDHSTDGTAALAIAAAAAAGAGDRLSVVTAQNLPAGWTGKLWAMEQGSRYARESAPTAEYILFTDADIAHGAGTVARLVARAEAGDLDLASLMVHLNCTSLAERMTVPAFIFFFQMLYPFRWVADQNRRIAAAAGGVVLLRRRALERIGGLVAIRGALIDDCTLAAAVKPGGRIWLGHSVETRSIRPYPHFADIWRMVIRTAYTQLDHSPLLLAGTVLGMGVVYLAPPLLAWSGGWRAALGIGSWVAMSIAYRPTLKLYGRSAGWGPLLPLVALFYLGATMESARRHWLGKGGEWKGRLQGAG